MNQFASFLVCTAAWVAWATPLYASSAADVEADLPRIGATLAALQSIARQGGSPEEALPEARQLLREKGILRHPRELYLLALLLPEVAMVEESEQPRCTLSALAQELKLCVDELKDYPARPTPWASLQEVSAVPLQMPRVLAVTGRIATIARNAERDSQRSRALEREWCRCDSPRRASARREAQALVDGLDSPKDIYAVAIMLREYQQLMGTVEDAVLWEALQAPVLRLCKLGTPEAYTYFLKLHRLYGRDGGESLMYREMEGAYFQHLLSPARRLELQPR